MWTFRFLVEEIIFGCFCVGFSGIMLPGMLMWKFICVCVFFVSHGNGNWEADVGGKEETCPVYSNRKAVVHSEK